MFDEQSNISPPYDENLSLRFLFNEQKIILLLIKQNSTQIIRCQNNYLIFSTFRYNLKVLDYLEIVLSVNIKKLSLK